MTGKEIKSIRFDPINIPAVVRMKDARIENKQSEVIKKIPLKDFRPIHQISKIETSDGVMVLHTSENANDPIINIENSIVTQIGWNDLIRKHGWEYLGYTLLSFLCLIGLSYFMIFVRHGAFKSIFSANHKA